ncbi:MAG: MBL fold metallo-hydrolase [Desulfobacterales bacterium]|nr:MBL fold metallo-hydrolase [Desulfobacterales bacterium]
MSSPSVEITVLVDNNIRPGLMAEHGFSLWIETDDQRILFDTGQGAALAFNAPALGVDLSRTDALVLSHGHYDHTGGIPLVVNGAGKVHVYCHSGAVTPHYAIRNGTSASIGMPRASMSAIDHLPSPRLHWVQQPLMLTERIGITGPIPRKTSYEDSGGPFFLDPEGHRADPVEDDLAIWIQTDLGLVVCVGCAHAGVVNTLNHARHLSGEPKVRAVIGGFHLNAASRQRLDQTIADLDAMDIETIIPCHCTGDEAVGILGDALGRRVSAGSAGEAYRF